MTSTPGPSRGWPFWAATSDDRIDEALRLAGLGPGERLIDLGCGDGRVLVRAASDHGAAVTGVELDPDLAGRARAALAAGGIDGVIVESDFATAAIEAEVVFAFLSPATLQRLRPRLEALPAGTRVVTTGYAVPGWVPHDLGDRCFLYRLPAREADIDRDARGWVAGGALVSLPADAPSLVAVTLQPPGGPVVITMSGAALDGWLEVRAGLDHAVPGEQVTVDLRFDPRPAGLSAAGMLLVEGLEPFDVFAVTDDGETGIWGLSPSGCRHVADLMAQGDVTSFLAGARRRTGSG